MNAANEKPVRSIKDIIKLKVSKEKGLKLIFVQVYMNILFIVNQSLPKHEKINKAFVVQFI